MAEYAGETESQVMILADYWNPPMDNYGEPVYGGTLRINYEDPLEHANTWGAGTGSTDRYRMPTGAMLVMDNPYDPDGDLLPDLAKSWVVHEDQQGVTFDFRENARWHNGEPFVCEDARFTFETMITGNGLTSSYMQRRLHNVILEELACLDDMALTIRFSKPTAIPLLHFSNRRAVIFNKEWFELGGEEAMFVDVSMGIGPFKWSAGQMVGIDEQRFDRNPDYFLPDLPYLDELVIHGILDEATQLATQLAHQTDWHWVRNWDQYRTYVDHDRITTVIRPTRGHFRLWLHPEHPPFENARIRQAIFIGIDRDAMIRAVQDGKGVKGGYGYRPGSKWELPGEERCRVPGWCQPRDISRARAEARKILKEEGFDFGKTYLITVESWETARIHALQLMEQLRLLGIKTDFDPPSRCYTPRCEWRWGHFLSTFSTVPADDPTEGVATFLDCNSPYNFWKLDSRKTSRHCDAELQELLAMAETETDHEKRLQMAHMIELAAMRQYSSLPIYWEQEAAAFWPEVRGYVHFPSPSGSFLKFMHMWIDPKHAGDTGNAGRADDSLGRLETPLVSWVTLPPRPRRTPTPTPDFWAIIGNMEQPSQESVDEALSNLKGIIVDTEDDAATIGSLIMLMTREQRKEVASEAYLLNQQLRSSLKFSPGGRLPGYGWTCWRRQMILISRSPGITDWLSTSSTQNSTRTLRDTFPWL